MDKLNSSDEKKVIQMLKRLTKVASSPEGRHIIQSSFGKKASRVSGVGQLLFKLKTMYSYFKDPTQSKGKKALVGAAILYFIFPIDAVNDFIPLLGYVDDAVAVGIIWKMLTKELDQYEGKLKDSQ